MRTSIPQIFEEVEKASTREQKIKILKAYDHMVLRGILRLAFDPNVKMLLPEGEPPFKKDKEVSDGYSETNLFVEYRRFYIWLDPTKNISKVRREQLFIQLLEGLHWKEAEVICLAKDKNLTKRYKTLKEDIVREAFPQILPPKVEKKKEEKEVTPKSSALGNS